MPNKTNQAYSPNTKPLLNVSTNPTNNPQTSIHLSGNHLGNQHLQQGNYQNYQNHSVTSNFGAPTTNSSLWNNSILQHNSLDSRFNHLRLPLPQQNVQTDSSIQPPQISTLNSGVGSYQNLPPQQSTYTTQQTTTHQSLHKQMSHTKKHPTQQPQQQIPTSQHTQHPQQSKPLLQQQNLLLNLPQQQPHQQSKQLPTQQPNLVLSQQPFIQQQPLQQMQKHQKPIQQQSQQQQCNTNKQPTTPVSQPANPTQPINQGKIINTFSGLLNPIHSNNQFQQQRIQLLEIQSQYESSQQLPQQHQQSQQRVSNSNNNPGNNKVTTNYNNNSLQLFQPSLFSNQHQQPRIPTNQQVRTQQHSNQLQKTHQQAPLQQQQMHQQQIAFQNTKKYQQQQINQPTQVKQLPQQHNTQSETPIPKFKTISTQHKPLGSTNNSTTNSSQIQDFNNQQNNTNQLANVSLESDNNTPESNSNATDRNPSTITTNNGNVTTKCVENLPTNQMLNLSTNQHPTQQFNPRNNQLTNPPINPPTSKTTNQPTYLLANPTTISFTNPPTNQPTNPPTYHLTNKPTNQLTNKSPNKPIHQPVKPIHPPTNQPLHPPTNQPIHTTTNQPTNPLNHPPIKDSSNLSTQSTNARDANQNNDYDEEDEEDDDNDEDDDDDYTTEDDASSNSGNPDYDLENQRYFNDSSAGRQMADSNHQVTKKNESTKANSAGQRSASSKRNTCQHNTTQRHEVNVSRVVDLCRERELIPRSGLEVTIPPQLDGAANKPICDPELMACTLNALPNTSALLSKARLPLGLIVHPLKEHKDVAIVKNAQIVRCRLCRMYMNPYVVVVDQRKWKCPMCSRFNDFPSDYLYNPRINAYTNGGHRPELNNASYELIAPSEYAVRAPQSPCYLFLLDVSFNAIDTGYLQTVCDGVLENLDALISKNKHTRVSFLSFNSHIHFYNLDASLIQPVVYHVVDIEDVQPPTPKGLIVPLKESKVLIKSLLTSLPSMHKDNKDVGSCFGAAVKAALKLLENSGGRVSVFQTKLPDVGDGSLKPREDPNRRAADTVDNLAAVTDFYKQVALICSSTHVSFDLFMLNSQYSDLATLSTLSRYSGGCMYYFPNYHYTSNPVEKHRLEYFLDRYFSREVGFEAVLRIRCTRGLSLQMFHGVGFVRSLDLLSLPQISSDTSYAVQLSIENQLTDPFALIQAALLYTNTKCERRIRVHTLCLPVTAFINDVFVHANHLTTVAMVAKMAVDKAQTVSVVDSREACTNVASDMLNSYGENLSSHQRSIQLPCPYLLRSLPLYMLALIKSTSFRLGVSTKVDDRSHHMELIKRLPLLQLLPLIHPFLYPLHRIFQENIVSIGDRELHIPPILPLSASSLDKRGAFLLDDGNHMTLWVFPAVEPEFLSSVLGQERFGDLNNGLIELPEFENTLSDNTRTFIEHLNYNRPFPSPLYLFRDDSRDRALMYDRLVEDRTSDIINMSYSEFLRHLIGLISYS